MTRRNRALLFCPHRYCRAMRPVKGVPGSDCPDCWTRANRVAQRRTEVAASRAAWGQVGVTALVLTAGAVGLGMRS